MQVLGHTSLSRLADVLHTDLVVAQCGCGDPEAQVDCNTELEHVPGHCYD